VGEVLHESKTSPGSDRDSPSWRDHGEHACPFHVLRVVVLQWLNDRAAESYQAHALVDSHLQLFGTRRASEEPVRIDDVSDRVNK
jgi:hypothetical protein